MNLKDILFESKFKLFENNQKNDINDNLFNNFFNYSSSSEIEHKEKKIKKNNDHKNNKRDLKTCFYWEDLNQKCPYDPKLKYCIYFKGCCCPPHVGHINSIKSAVKQFPGCKVIVNQMGLSTRHGTPRDFNSHLLQKYLSKIFKNTKVKYMLKTPSKKIFTDEYVLDSDVLIIIRGDEIEKYALNKEYLAEIHNEKREKNIQKYVKNLNKNGIKLIFLIQKRNVNKVSASKFIETLNIYKDKLSSGIKSQKDLEKVMNFIPHELNYDEKLEIINEMIKFKTWSEKK
jgi:nicotinamide mononucleotide adenylyltransferase